MKIKYKILIIFQIYCCILNDSWAEVKIEKVVPPIVDNVKPVAPDIVSPPITDNVVPISPVNPPITDNVTPVVPDIISPPITDNLNNSTTDNAPEKTVIDSKINSSMTGYVFDPKVSKINPNNFALGISLGRKFEANNLFNFSDKYNEFFRNK